MSNEIDIKLEPNNFKYFNLSSNKGFLYIPFDEIFKEKDLSFLNEFNLKRKRTYVNISELICTYNNKLLSMDHSKYIIMNYLLLKYKINSDKYKTNEEFISDLYHVLFIENNYQFELDKKEIKKYNPGLQFTDTHAKILHMISTSMKLIIPLLLEYAFIKNVDVLDFNEFILQCYDPLFTMFIKNDETDLANKLYQSVYSRVIATKYSDNTFWSYCTSIGFSPEELTFNLTKKLMIDIVPKYKFSENIISFNHVVVNNSIEYTFRFNFPVNFKALSLVESDEDGLTEFDKVGVRRFFERI